MGVLGPARGRLAGRSGVGTAVPARGRHLGRVRRRPGGAPVAAAGHGDGVVAAPERIHHLAQLGRGGGRPLREDARAQPRHLPVAQPRDRLLAAGRPRLPHRRNPVLPDGASGAGAALGRRPRRRRLPRRPVLRGGQRLAAQPIPRRPRQPGQGHGPGPLAMDPPPQLLRRHRGVARLRAGQRRVRGVVGDLWRGADGRADRARVRRCADGPVDVRRGAAARATRSTCAAPTPSSRDRVDLHDRSPTPAPWPASRVPASLSSGAGDPRRPRAVDDPLRIDRSTWDALVARAEARLPLRGLRTARDPGRTARSVTSRSTTPNGP